MSKRAFYRFKIDAFTPETLPLARLAEYIADLAVLFGNKDNVHFVKLDKSSATSVLAVDYTAVPKVKHRLKLVSHGDAPEDAAKASENLNQKLAQDNAKGELWESGKKKGILQFPGRDREVRETFGPFNELGSLEGELIKLGGAGDPVPIHLRTEDNQIYICQASKSLARKIAGHIFGPPLRVHGEGRWERDEKGQWRMIRFSISGFKILDGAPLSEAVEKLRSIKSGAPLKDLLKELDDLRGS